MKKIIFTICFLISAHFVSAQIEKLNTNGHSLDFQKIDTLFYVEYSITNSAYRNAGEEDYSTMLFENKTAKIFRNKTKFSQTKPTFTSNYYVYSDGTLEAPTSQLFLKTNDLEKLRMLYGSYGSIEPHKVFKGFYYFNITSEKYNTGEFVFKLCREIYNQGLVTLIEPVFSKLLPILNPLRPYQWNIKNNLNVQGASLGADMKVENAWCTSTGLGIKVAIIDDGVDLSHPDLQSNLLPGYDATGNNSSGAPSNNNAHGTNCAGIIASVNNSIGTIGVSYNAKVIPIRQGIVSGNVYNTNDTWQSNCFNEAVSRGADIISNSWGGGSTSAQLETAIQNATNNGRNGKGCIVLFAAGNQNKNISYPSSLSYVISIGASTPCDTRKRSSDDPSIVNPGTNADPEGTSCDGEYYWGSNFGTGLDLIAPGVKITTTDLVGSNGYSNGDYYDLFNGTSSACPNTAAVVALILSANSNLTGLQARNILEQTCDKVGGYNYQTNVSGQPNGAWNSQAGYGRVNADRAVLAALNQTREINGPTVICNTGESYTIPNIPCNSNVIWSVSASSGGSVTLSNYSGTTTSIIIPTGFPSSASITLTATVSTLSYPLIKQIFYGIPGFGVSYSDGKNSGNPVLIYNPSNPDGSANPVCIGYGFPNTYIDASPYGNTTGVWTVPAGYAHNGFSLTQQTGNRAYFSFNYSGAPNGFLKYTVTNSCSSSSLIFAFKQVNCGTQGDPCSFAKTQKYFTISPNPADGFIKIGISSKPAPPDCDFYKSIRTEKGLVFSKVNIYTNSGTKIREVSYKNSKQATISTSHLTPGIYLVEIIQENYMERQHLIIY